MWTDVKEYIRTCEICMPADSSSSLYIQYLGTKVWNSYGTEVLFSSINDAMDRKMQLYCIIMQVGIAAEGGGHYSLMGTLFTSEKCPPRTLFPSE